VADAQAVGVRRETLALKAVETLRIEGRLPKRVIGLVLEWAFEHRDELMENWELTKAKKPLRDILPLE